MVNCCNQVRTLRKDLLRYNRIPTDEEKAEELEELGWKLVHGDVFRPPSMPLLFSVVIGSGIQCFWMAFATISFAALGFLSPANRGSFITAFLVLFILLGSVGGFYSARLYKTLNGTGYQATTFLTAFGFPGLIFAGFFIINLFVWGYGSSAALPFTSMLAVCALWFGISVPLTFFGAFVGYGRDSYEHPTRVNTLPRQIPDVPWFMTSMISVFIGGILPFGTVSIELYFIMTSIWFGTTYYYVFGFLLVVGLLLFVTLAEMSITLTYFQLCAEDYHWWWRSFFVSGSCAVYVFCIPVIFLQHKVKWTIFQAWLCTLGTRSCQHWCCLSCVVRWVSLRRIFLYEPFLVPLKWIRIGSVMKRGVVLMVRVNVVHM